LIGPEAGSTPVSAKIAQIESPAIGEAGTTAAPCAIVNAVANAPPARAAAAIQISVTAQAVWRALHGKS
jgi:hypothetical protein